MTRGKILLIVVFLILIVFVIGEIIFRIKKWKMKKDTNLSDYGISQELNRDECYFDALIFVLIASVVIAVILAIIKLWNIPL